MAGILVWFGCIELEYNPLSGFFTVFVLVCLMFHK